MTEKYIEFQIGNIWSNEFINVEGLNNEQIETFAQKILPDTKYRVVYGYPA
jgi:hypothetical protein